MEPKYIIMISCIIFSLSGAEALKFDQTIAVDGSGDLYTRTDIPYAKDLAQGLGAQNYSLAFDFQNALSGSFRSKYALRSASNNKSDQGPASIPGGDSEKKLDALPVTMNNRYQVGLTDNSLQYVASINRIEEIYTDSSIELMRNDYGSYQVITNYDIGGQGALKQKITERDTNMHPTVLSEARVNGNFSLSSNMEDEIQKTLSDIDYSSPEYLSAKLSDANKSIEAAQNAGKENSNRNIGGFAVNVGRFFPLRSDSSELAGSYNLLGIVFNGPAGCMVP